MHGRSSRLRRGTNRLDTHRDFRERELKLNKSITNKVAALLYMKFSLFYGMMKIVSLTGVGEVVSDSGADILK